MWAVVVAGIDMVDARCEGLSQDSNRSVYVSWRPPYFRARKLHRAVTHTDQLDWSAGKCKVTAKFHLFRHCVSPFSRSALLNFLACDIRTTKRFSNHFFGFLPKRLRSVGIKCISTDYFACGANRYI